MPTAKRLGVLGVWSLLLVLVSLAGVAQAAEACSNRGTLDSMYCDEDKDLIADVPKDKSQWKNPSTLVFTYSPVEDPAVTRQERATVLDANTTFQRRLEQIAHYGKHGDHHRRREIQHPGQPLDEDATDDSVAESAEDPGRDAFPRFAGADAGRKAAPTEGTANEICRDIRDPD